MVDLPESFELSEEVSVVGGECVVCCVSGRDWWFWSVFELVFSPI